MIFIFNHAEKIIDTIIVELDDYIIFVYLPYEIKMGWNYEFFRQKIRPPPPS